MHIDVNEVCRGNIQAIRWSPDSKLVAASCIHGPFDSVATIVHIFSVHTPDWKAVIKDGALSGVANILFTPDSRHLIVVSEYHIRLTVWSLSSKVVRNIRFPKSLSFDNSGQFLAVVASGSAVTDGGGSGEAISIYDMAGNWAEVSRFFVNIDCSAVYVTRMMWNPSGYLIALYMPLQNLVQIRDPRGLLVFLTSSGGDFAWSPCGSLFLTSGTDDNLTVFNCLNWSQITTLTHTDIISKELEKRNCVVLEEKVKESEDIDNNLVSQLLNIRQSSYEKVTLRPLTLSRLPPIDAKKQSHVGLRFSPSPDGLFVASKSERMPAVIWIWNMQKTQLDSVLIHRDRVVSFTWEPTNSAQNKASRGTRLLILTKGARNVFVWTRQGAIVLQMPTEGDSELGYARASWSPKGGSFAIVGKEKFICCKI